MPSEKAPPHVVFLPLGAPEAGASLQSWLYESLRRAILGGRLPTGSKLPSTRAMAEHYSLARGTVQAAYQQLLSEGYLQARTGSGTRVSEVLPDPTLNAGYVRRKVVPVQEEKRSAPETPWLKRLDEIVPIFSRRTLPSGLRPFFPHRGDINAFPIDLWRKLHTQQLRSSRLSMLLDSDPAGLPELREAIASYLAIARGVQVSPERILVLSSVQQGLDICLRLLAPGDSQVWMEDPGYPGARQLMDISGVRRVDVPVDRFGMQVEEGMRQAPAARLAYVTPSRQAPLGGELSPARRLALLKWAAEQGSYIFEDDYDSEYRFIAKPIPALRSMPAAEHSVILAGTFSKLLFPSVRLAYLVLPEHLLESFTRASALMSRHANSLAQAVLADFIHEGHFDRHVRRMRKIYASRAEAFAEAAHRHWQGLIEVPEIRAGMDIACQLQVESEQDAFTRLQAAGIDTIPLSRYCVNTRAAGLVMGFAPYEERTIEDAAKAVALALRG
ncbi:GntR family transcriptional regulator [Ectopseudomonas oleovorans]|uniref:GntR family transcriptional regulator n=2 Tax=Pseudomonadaceae TaxID=135621 RepID=A0A397NR65_ECTOL|nr:MULTISPECIES: PLP-dependent aminotransferase family protein [Pseudomonas]QMV65920.1 PLP-dependent aminotransferase family protein [Pseudomonas berkeleyensis]RIA35921.1 GntR family transcriptional regulator [Pseudomonas oleovorans]WSO41410.1 PLP-dependent aminotransferase family protein [Pseudomonas berkeleyensis]